MTEKTFRIGLEWDATKYRRSSEIKFYPCSVGVCSRLIWFPHDMELSSPVPIKMTRDELRIARVAVLNT